MYLLSFTDTIMEKYGKKSLYSGILYRQIESLVPKRDRGHCRQRVLFVLTSCDNKDIENPQDSL